MFALETDLIPTGQSEPDRYKSLIGTEHTWVIGICVAGRASWFSTEKVVYDKDSGMVLKDDLTEISGEWRKVEADADHAEVLALLTAVTQLIQRVGPSRGQPPLDAYLNPVEEEGKKKIKITSGPHRGLYVGLDNSGLQAKVRLHSVPYSFFPREDAAFEFRSDKATEMRSQLKSMGIESDLV